MKSATGNIELPQDTDGAKCDGCKALKANVDVRGGRVRSVKLRCEVADALDAIDGDKDEGVPVKTICRRNESLRADARSIMKIQASLAPYLPVPGFVYTS